MSWKDWLLRVFPRPRGPVTWRDALPLLVFAAAYAGVCAALEMTDTLLFARPEMFALSAVMVWIWWMHLTGMSGLGLVRARVALLVRLTLVGVFVMLLAEPRAVRTSDVLSVVYAIDISDSVGEGSTDSALEFVMKTVTEKPSKDEAGLIVFGRNASVELPPGTSLPFEAINSRIDRDATDLAKALSLSGVMLPEENLGRIVLISDGTNTEGSLAPVLDELKSREIAVDVMPIEYDYQAEVWLERLELPRYIKVGENYEASILLSSLTEGSGRLVVRENGKVVSEDVVSFKPGKNRYIVPIKLRAPGYYEYSATIELAGSADHLQQNNTVLNYVFIEGEGRLLVVTDPQGEPRDHESLVAAMREAERVIDVSDSFDFPRDAMSLLPYDAVVFVNAPADAFDAVQLQALRDSVRDLGIGFLMVGGKNSFGPGGYHRTMVEEALPVTMDVTKKKILPKGALVIILHTCEFPEGNTWGKRITKEAIKVLGDQDEVGVLAHDWQLGDSWVFELSPVSEFDMMVRRINAAEIGDMPFFAPTMENGLEALLESDAATRHMIIISDSDPEPPPPSLLQDFVKNQVSVSTIAIFPHTPQDVQRMVAIANITGGRFYNPQDPNLLPSIFIKESKTLKRGMIQTKTIVPEVGFPSPVLKGIDHVPPLHGYVLATAKPRAETILRAPAEQEQLDPILARGKFGLGTTAAFTSDLSPNWGADWLEWDKYSAFVKQLMIDISRVRRESHLRLWSYTQGNEGVIVVEDFHPEASFLDLRANVSGPRERSEVVPLRQVGPRRYQATVPLWGRGRYQVMAGPVAGDRKEERVPGGFIVPYSPEYLRFRSNPIVLNEIAERTGGRVLTKSSTSEDIYSTRRKPKQSSLPIFDWFLVALAVLVPLDVGVRRIQLDFGVIKGLFTLGRKSGPSTQTMGALLERKKAVGSSLQTRRSDAETKRPERPAALFRDAVGSERRTTPDGARREAASPASGKTEPPAGDDESTTARLLAMKRKRQEPDDKQ